MIKIANAFANCRRSIVLPLSLGKGVQRRRFVHQRARTLPDGPSLKEFVSSSGLQVEAAAENVPYLELARFGLRRKVFFDIYGCQMNFNDTEIIWSILKANGYRKTEDVRQADVVLVVTCAIRDGAEAKIWNKIDYLKGLRNARRKTGDRTQMRIGILGCMAERLKHQLLEKEQAIDLGELMLCSSSLARFQSDICSCRSR